MYLTLNKKKITTLTVSFDRIILQFNFDNCLIMSDIVITTMIYTAIFDILILTI